MKTNKKNIIIPALMMAVGLGLVGSISGTVAWYQYSTRVTTSYIGASAKCTESLQVSLTGVDNEFVSELETADIIAAATANDTDGSDFQPVTSAAAHATAVVSGAQTYAFKGHPMYQNFAYDTWQDAPANSYLQYDLYFRVLDVDGAATKSYIAKKLYFEDFVINFTGTNSGASTTAFKDALRFQFDQVNGTAKSTLLSNTARSAMKLGGSLDLNGDGEFDQTHAYEWETATDAVYGNESLTQTTAAFADYKGTLTNGKLVAGSNELGTTVAGTYSAASALHFKVTIWLEGWDATGTTAATSIWDAKDYIGSFQIGMTFGVTPYGEE